MSQIHTVEAEATVKVKVKFSNVVESSNIAQIREETKMAAEKIIAEALRRGHGYRSNSQNAIEPGIKQVLDTSASTVSVGKIVVDL